MNWEWIKLGVTTKESFIFMVCWIAANAGVFTWGYLGQKNDPNLSRLNDPIGASIYISRGAGLCLVFQCGLIVLPVCRNLMAMLRTVPIVRNFIVLDKNIHLHKIIAWTMVFFTIVHVVAHLFNFRVVENEAITIMKSNNSALYLLWSHPAGITGVIMVSLLFLIVTSALATIRTRCFELFWYLHHLSLPFLFTLCFHAFGCFVKRTDGSCKPYGAWKFATVGIVLYVLERLARKWRSMNPSFITKVVAHPGDTVEIQFQKRSMIYLPGQYVFINIPEISRFQWHPFTVTSAPEEAHVSVHIRIVGDWTEAVAKRLGYVKSQKMDPVPPPDIRIDGPFGTPSQQVFDYQTLVLIGAGIGITPFASVLKSIYFRRQHSVEKSRLKVQKVHLFWVCRTSESFSWFQDLLRALEGDLDAEFLQVHIFLTGALSPSQVSNIALSSGSGTEDAITKLRARTNFGRPNFETFFQQMRARQSNLLSSGKESVGVFYCGPVGLKRKVKQSCRSNSTDTFKLDFFPEKFN